jgi:8-oxo-dGTP diphosphatase
MKESETVPTAVLAAGGIVVREARRPLIAVVRLRKEKAWVLPKGKLKAGESALAAARREVREETGHDVTVHEFLGSMSHTAQGRHKIVQFWRMSASAGPAHKLMADVKAVKWLPLKQAVETLTRAHERVFLANVGPVALRAARQSLIAAESAEHADMVDAPAQTSPPTPRPGLVNTMRAWLRGTAQQRLH